MNEELVTAIMECCEDIERLMSTDTLLEFIKLPEDNLCLCHFGLGLFLRNNIMPQDGRLYSLFITNGVMHKDDMSSIIIRELHKKLRESEYK